MDQISAALLTLVAFVGLIGFGALCYSGGWIAGSRRQRSCPIGRCYVIENKDPE
jgi:hypothetical protein